AVLRRLGQLIRRDLDSLARLESLDTGKPLSQARGDAEVAAQYFEFYADTVKAFHGEVIPSAAADALLLALPEPHGVTAHIVPWNYPLAICARTVAPALASGNCCVLKPAEEAPLTSLRVAELALEAGLPAGAYNVVSGIGIEAGAALAGHPDIDHLSFTGSTTVGSLVSQAAGANHVPVTLELGGKSPQILFADANFGAALAAVAKSIVHNAGQTCSAGTRLLVEHSREQEAVEALREHFAKVQIGPGPSDPELGPLISRAQRERVERLVSIGRGEARLVVGGEAPKEPELSGGFYFLPTLFDQVAPAALIAQEEIFGPVLSVIPFGSEREAIELANHTRYGLVAAIWTKDIDRALWLARELRSGQVFVNNFGSSAGVELPFGGAKHSGHGREKGFEALRTYTRTKAVAVKFQGYS
ncbi:MAG: aldehyde dehydrogenase family protein, partial [Candidatus Dormibacteraceae bacterium]